MKTSSLNILIAGNTHVMFAAGHGIQNVHSSEDVLRFTSHNVNIYFYINAEVKIAVAVILQYSFQSRTDSCEGH